MEEENLKDTKGLPTFSITLSPGLSLDLSQLNNTQMHGTTVWDSAKVLAFYLMDTLKRPSSWTFSDDGKLMLQNPKRCIELGSGCGLGGLTMAALGYETTVTDLPFVVDHVLRTNLERNTRTIKDWWYQLLAQNPNYVSSRPTLADPPITVEPLDWLRFTDENEHDYASNFLRAPYHYILAADCIYCLEMLPPLLKSCHKLASPTTVILVALERRDDIVVNNFVEQAKKFGFDARMIPKKTLRSKLVGNEDIEIWKLKKKRSTK
ncbi:putative methyltransferase-domain-containing protein [Dichotomocladium elegans]|nr:putative methyltransferase-domain-containing protein [Dichotomocladium elegans]